MSSFLPTTEYLILENIKNTVYSYCESRNSEHISCLMSGGLSSTLVTYFANEYCKNNKLPKLGLKNISN